MMRAAGLTIAGAMSLVGCGGIGIGDGNAPKSMEIRVGGLAEGAEVFVCSSQVPQARLEFTDGSIGDFVYRVDWTSSDPDILTVSDGTIAAPSGVFVNGALLPKSPGTVTLTASYLDGQFTDDIDVTVSPATLELSPAYSLSLVTRTAQVVDTVVSQGLSRFFSSDLNQVGSFSVDGVDPDEFDDDPETELPEAPITIDTTSGVITTTEAGTYTVRYRVDFCDTEATATLDVADEAVEAVVVRDRKTQQPISSLELLLDSSRDIDVIGVLESGREIALTNAVSYSIVDENDESVTDLAFTSLRGLGTVTAYARPEAVDGEEAVSYPRQARLRISYDPTPADETEAEEADDVFAPDIALTVLDAELVPETFVVEPVNQTILPGTGFTYTATADFSGPAGDFPAVDVRQDVQWLSDDLAIATINNAIGSKGFAFAPSQRVQTNADDEAEIVDNLGDVTITAQRFSGAATEDDENPSTEGVLVVGRPTVQEGEVELSAATLGMLEISLFDENATRNFHDGFFLSANGTLERDGEEIGTQILSGQVIWDIVQGSEFAQISNRSGRKGQVIVLTDQTVTITVRARFFSTVVQDEPVSATFDVELNPVVP